VVSAASYEARAFGVRSAMPVVQARRLCPGGVFLPGRYARYKELSGVVMACLAGFSPLVEPASIDEAYVDMTGSETLFGGPQRFGARMREAVFEATGLSCSVGVAPVKFLAKIASDFRKPGGLTVVSEGEVAAFLAVLPVGRIPGVGRRTLEALTLLGIRTAGDMLVHPPEFFGRRLGAAAWTSSTGPGGWIHSPVSSGRQVKSVSAENTFERDVASRGSWPPGSCPGPRRVGRELRRRGGAAAR
jgi:DNA polymerase-4